MSKDEAGTVINNVIEKQPQAGKTSRLRRWGRRVAVLFALFLLWYLICGRGVPPRISEETTWITEPRTADRKWIDYCKAYEEMYYPPEMQTDENGYRIIARHLGLPEYRLTYYDPKTKERKEYDLDKEALRAQGYEKLGLPPDNKPDMKFVTSQTFLLNYAKETHPNDEKAEHELQTELLNRHNQFMSEPWTLDEYPMMTQWLEQNTPVLDLVSEAVAKPAFFQPLVIPEGNGSLQQYLIELSLSSVQEFRSFAREFMVRFQYRLGKGDIDGAIDDKIATHRLGRHILNQPTLIAYLVGIALDGMAYWEGIADNLEAQPTADQIRRLMQLQSELQPGITVQEALETERLMVLDGLQGYARGKPSSPADNIPPMLNRFWGGAMPYDWNIVMSRANKYLDGELEVKVRKPSSGNFVWTLFNSIFSRNKRSEFFIDTMASLFVPAVHAAEEAKRRHSCSGNIQQITLAMLLYHAEHGTLPPAYSLDANGRPLHSWRVLLLPYLGDAELAALSGQIRLNEAWDSEHNRQFHELCPTVYRCPTHGLKPGDTAYCVITGDETPFDVPIDGSGSGIGKALTGFGPESSGMVLVAETRTSGNWMNPQFDVTFDQAKTGITGYRSTGMNSHLPPDNAIGSYHTVGVNVGLRNGGVSFISETINLELWERVLTGKERMKW